MSTIINASTTGGLIVTPDLSGQLQFQLNGVNVPSPTTVPTFCAYPSVSTTITGSAFTKIIFDTKEWDTANCYNTTNYRFTPNVAGYYQINANVMFSNVSNWYTIYLYKNGSAYRQGNETLANSGSYNSTSITTLVYFNGTTDYVEIYGTGGATFTVPNTGNSTYNYFTGVLVRPA